MLGLLYLAGLVFIVATIMLIVYAVKMNRTRSKRLGSSAVVKITANAAREATREKTEITCEYCGSKINTLIDRNCPQCGASYGKNRQWLERIQIDENAMEQIIDREICNEKEIVEGLNWERKRNAKIIIGIIVALFVSSIALIVVGMISVEAEKAKDGTLRGGFEDAGYGFEGKDAILVNTDDVRVVLGEVYIRPTTGEKAVEVRITNRTDKTGDLFISAMAVNNRSVQGSLWEKIASKAEVVRYMELFCTGQQGKDINTLWISKIRYSLKESGDHDPGKIVFEQKDLVKLTTAAKSKMEPIVPEGTNLHEENGITFSYITEKDRQYIQITNTSPNDYELRGMTKNLEFMREVSLPTGFQYIKDLKELSSLSDIEEIISKPMQIECTCCDNTDLDFVAGPFTIQNTQD